MAKPKIKRAILLVELEEGGIHQVALKDNTGHQLLAVLAQLEGYVKIIEKPIDGLYIDISKSENDTEEGKQD
jgi:hypothetical protein